MIDNLKKYYEIEITEYIPYEAGILFYLNGSNYYFTKSYLNEEQINEINIILKNNKYRLLKLHSFVYNKNRKMISDGYVLLKVNVFVEKISLYDLKQFNLIDMSEYKENYLYMDNIWEQKIDYLEMQISELLNNKLINNSFDYFVGIAEIIISFFKKNYNKAETKLILSHQYLHSINTLDFYNPLLISYDHSLKDICTYIKKSKNEELLINVIENIDFNSKIYMFSRMAFPTEYFYEIEQILFSNHDEKKLVEIVNNIDLYEKGLSKLEKYFGIKIFKWIKIE